MTIPFLQILTPIKGLMKTTLQTELIMQVGAKITAVMSLLMFTTTALITEMYGAWGIAIIGDGI